MGHDYQDRVSLELARRVAARLPHRPELLQLARENLDRALWNNASSPAIRRACTEWLELLDRPIDEIIAILTDETDDGQRLRQNSPPTGAIPARDVWEVKQKLRSDNIPSLNTSSALAPQSLALTSSS